LRGARLALNANWGNSRMEIVIRHAEPDDYEAIYRILSGPRLVSSLRFSLWYSLILSQCLESCGFGFPTASRASIVR
jgi:hypothetical protein